MFDIAWSELLVIGIVALIVVGPKELPTLLRTIGKYLGIVKRQAAEFRAQFDEAIRDTELEKIKQDIDSIRSDAEGTFRSAGQKLQDDLDPGIDHTDYADESAPTGIEADAHDADGLPINEQPTGTPGSAAAAAAAAAAEEADKEPAKAGA